MLYWWATNSFSDSVSHPESENIGIWKLYMEDISTTYFLTYPIVLYLDLILYVHFSIFNLWNHGCNFISSIWMALFKKVGTEKEETSYKKAVHYHAEKMHFFRGKLREGKGKYLSAVRGNSTKTTTFFLFSVQRVRAETFRLHTIDLLPSYLFLWKEIKDL